MVAVEQGPFDTSGIEVDAHGIKRYTGLTANAVTLLQETVADDFRGRVFSFYDTLFNVSFVAAAAASAVLLPPDGKSYLVIGIVAAGYALTALVYGLLTARRAADEPPEPVVRTDRADHVPG